MATRNDQRFRSKPDLRDRSLLVIICLRDKHATEPVDHISLVAIYHVAIGRLHFDASARGPRTATQHAPFASRSRGISLVTFEAPFPNIAPQIVNAQCVRLETSHRHGCAAARRCAIVARARRWWPL